MSSESVQEWINALTDLAQARGDVNAAQAGAIKSFIEAVTGEFGPGSLVKAYIAYETFTNARKTGGTGKPNPQVVARLDALEARVSALEQSE